MKAELQICLAVFLASFAVCFADDVPDGPVEGRAALQDGFYEMAEAKFAAWLKDRKEPRDEALEVLNLYCRALDGLSRTNDIRKTAQTGKPSALDVSGTAFSAYWNAYCDYLEGKFAAATNTVAGLSSKPGAADYSANALRLKGWSLLALGSTNEAINVFVEFEKKHPSDSARLKNLVQLGSLLLGQHDLQRAIPYLSKAEGMEGSDLDVAHAQHLLARAYRMKGNGREARTRFEALASNDDFAGDLRAEAWLEAAEIGASTGDFSGAVSACIEGLKLTSDPGLQMRGGILHGRALIDSGKLQEGVSVLKEQVVKMTDRVESAELQLEIGRALLKAGKNGESISEFQSYLETFTNAVGLVDAHLGKGWGLFRLERFAEAAGEFSKAYEMSESKELQEESLYKMGDAYFANGQYKLALDAYNEFVKKFKDSERARDVEFQIAEALAGSGKREEAEQQYAFMADKYADTDLGAEARLKMGVIKFERDDFKGALDDFEAVMAKFPRTDFYVRALHGRAKTYFRSGQYKQALKDLERITKQFPDSTSAEDAMYEQGLCQQRLGQDEEVKKAFEELLKRYPNSSWAPDVVFWQGEQAFNKGDFKKAEEIFLGFVEQYTNSVVIPEALLRAGMAAGKRKEYVHANELFNKLAKEHPNSIRIPDARFAQANVLAELGRFPEAILPLDEIINKYPDSELVMQAWGRKGDCHFMMGSEDKTRYEEAIQSYRVVVSSSKSSKSMVLQSEYKIGRCYEKMGKTGEALERYYMRVVVPFLEQKERGEKHDESARVWFTRACMSAVDILESQQDWRRAANILERLGASGVPASKEAKARAKKIRTDYWWLFY